ncbi:MAG TPA: SGNH/GDSL hydrolase family protein, partial [Planctomycetaceae bacterium]
GLGHHRLRPLQTTAVRDPDAGDAVEVAVNSHGLRGPEVAVPKPPGVYRVLCLGDETVLGPQLPESLALPAQLKEFLQARTALRVEVLNAGLPGGCPLLAWLRLRHSLLGLQPDLIVLHVDMTDVADDRCYRRRTRVDRADVPIACVHPSLGEAGSERDWWRDLRVTALLAQGLGLVGPTGAAPTADEPAAATAWLRDHPEEWGPHVEQSLTPIEAIRDAAAGAGAALVVSTCPQPWQVSLEASAGPGVREAAGVAPGAVLTSRAPFEAITAFAESRGVACCDASAAFGQSPDASRLYFRNAPQLSREGHLLYARILGEFIASRVPVFGGPGNSSGIPGATVTFGD